MLEDTDSDNAPSSSNDALSPAPQLDPQATVFITERQRHVLPRPPISPITPPATRPLTINKQFPDSSVLEPVPIRGSSVAMSTPTPVFTAAQQEVMTNAIITAVAQALRKERAFKQAPSVTQPAVQHATKPAALTADLQPVPEYYLLILDPSILPVESNKHMSPDFADTCKGSADVLRILDHRFFDHNRVQSARKNYYQLTMIEKYKMHGNYEQLDEYLAIINRESRNIKSEEAAIARRYASYASSSANVSFTASAGTSGTRSILKKESWRPTPLSPAPRATSPAPSPLGSRSASPSNVTCYSCKKPGHIQRECPDLKLDKKIAKMVIELARNGFYIKTTAHIDGGANIFSAIKTSLASQLSLRFGNKFITLPHPIVPTKYNSTLGDPITHAILLTLTIDRRRINFPFLVTNLGSTDVLISRKFLAHYDIGQRFGAKPQLYWPADMPVIPYFSTRIFLDLSHPASRLNHQADAARRDQLLDDQDAAPQISILKPAASSSASIPHDRRSSSFVRDLQKRLSTIEKHLRCLTKEVDHSLPQSKDEPCSNLYQQQHTVNISFIGASPMRATLNRFRKNYKAATQASGHPPDEFVFSASMNDFQREQDRRRIDAEDKQTIQIASINNADSAHALREKYAANNAKVNQELPLEYTEFKDLFSKKASDMLTVRRPKVDHKIVLATENTLITKPLRRLTDDQLSKVKQYIQDHLHKRFIEPSNAPYSAPILFTKKKDGSIKLCVDYRRLNSITQKDPYPLPLIDEMMARISQAKIFTKIDIQQAFHRIRISLESEDLTTFRSRYGTYKYKVLPFGLTNRPATFQRFINEILIEHLDDFCSAYLNDILIYSTNELEHTEHVKKIMRILNDHGLQADIKKCEFSVYKTKFLKFIINTNDIEVDPDKIADKLKLALQHAPILCHFDPYKQTRLETDSSDSVVTSVLSQLQDDGFYHPVEFFSKTMTDAKLNYPIHDKELLAIFRSFQNYKLELLGSQKSIHVYTDHRTLEYFMTTKDLTARQARWAEFFANFHFLIMYRSGATNTLADALSRRDQDISPLKARQRAVKKQQLLPNKKLSPKVLQDLHELSSDPPAELAKYSVINDSVHVVQSIPVVLAPIQGVPSDLPISEDVLLDEDPAHHTNMIAYDIDGYDIIDRVLQSNRDSLLLQDLRDSVTESHDIDHDLRNSKLYFQGRLVVPLEPPELRTALIRHGLGSDVTRYISNCKCARMKAKRDKTPGLLVPLPIPARPNQHLTVDFTELPLDEDSYDFALVIVCRLSKRSVTLPCHKEVTAKDLAVLFLTNWVRYFGMPDSIVSDRSPQFVSAFWREFCKIFGTKVKLTTAYNPNVDKQTEVMNHHLVPLIDVAQLTLPHESLKGITPFQVANSYESRSSFDLVNPEPPSSATERLNRAEAVHVATRAHDAIAFAQSSIAVQQEKMKRLADLRRRPVDWTVEDEVWIDTRN
ncbi:polymerase [Drepanopeziza brunnea f. sp. 'multigermtubi' MB_m1]|uniref:Polymerase n=1 Tax=Marssonina brunnea f. sp. multigermtubi (strain MB_m1) TaxID=1072389 RepID=K1XAN4_MARBU|nr:polymerase [Drepanopeziza brunnea f. sp. 'multigermtubi' MB_m1]EKD17763.1 polymerase [Drepanopeziza brunnea f. sp. 'multigermtubi' MB_m1]